MTAKSNKRKDTLYNVESVEKDFAFSQRVVEVFDDMLDRSIPHYQEVIAASAQILNRILQDNDVIVDLGCATGTTLLEFSRRLENKSLRYIGVDNSQAMLEKARLKTELYNKQNLITFQEQDIKDISLPDCGAFILNYTMQFLRPVQRESFLTRIVNNLRPGGILLLSEKTISHDPYLNRLFIDFYHNYKRDKGYSELEIAKKREALENVLIPFSIDENRALLKKVGFHSVETYFQWFNFVSIVAVKPHLQD